MKQCCPLWINAIQFMHQARYGSKEAATTALSIALVVCRAAVHDLVL
jgi:hypothetical protein